MMMEFMGLHAPGSAFVNPGTTLRRLYVEETARLVAPSARSSCSRAADCIALLAPGYIGRTRGKVQRAGRREVPCLGIAGGP